MKTLPPVVDDALNIAPTGAVLKSGMRSPRAPTGFCRAEAARRDRKPLVAAFNSANRNACTNLAWDRESDDSRFSRLTAAYAVTADLSFSLVETVG
jgi:hypothetical protein